MAYFNALGQGRVGWKSGVIAPTPVNVSSLWTSVYAVYNADSVGSSSLNTSLFAAYNGESNANDSFGTNNGTAVGGLTYTTGKIGNAFQFNGSNAVVALPVNSMKFTGDYSFSFFVNLGTVGSSTQTVFSSENWIAGGGDRGYIINFINGVLYFEGYNNSAFVVRCMSTTTVSANQWYHFTITKTSSQVKMYMNGSLQTTTNYTGVINYNPTVYPAIGALYYQNGTNSYNFMSNGSKIDAFSVWNKELTSSEVTELYNSGNGAQYITDSFYKPTTNDALNTYNGTAQGGLTYGVGKVGTAFQFNGTTSYVQLGDVMDVGTSSWSYSMWFNTNDGITNQLLFSKALAGSSTGRVWASFLNNRITFNFQADGSNIINTEMNTSTVGANIWYHLVVILDRSDKLKIYLNGTLQGLTVTSGTNNLTPYTATNYNTTHPFRIGAYTASDNTTPIAFFNGKIDAFNAWNRVLTQSEITELYNSGNGKQYPN